MSLGVELDDQLFLGRERYVAAHRHSEDPADPLLLVQSQPVRKGRPQPRLEIRGHHLQIPRALSQSDFVASGQPIARDIDARSVHEHMPMRYQLPGLAAAGGKAQTEDHVVEPDLESHDQILAGDSGAAGRVPEQIAELLSWSP